MPRKKNRETYNLSIDAMSEIIDSVFTKGMKNRTAIKSLVLYSFSSKNIETLIELMNKKTIYKELEHNGLVSIDRGSWELRHEKYEMDVLKDAGIITDNLKLVGIIKKDNGWDKDKFNPYSNSFYVDVFLHNDNKQIITKEIELNLEDLEPIAKSKIKYFSIKPDK